MGVCAGLQFVAVAILCEYLFQRTALRVGMMAVINVGLLALCNPMYRRWMTAAKHEMTDTPKGGQ